MTQEVLDKRTGELVDLQAPADLTMLDVYSPEPTADEEPRLDALATVSAGYRGEGTNGHAGLPQVSRKGQIYLHDAKGRAPGLKRALDATEQMRLTVAFPFNNPSAFVQQRFTEYSSTHLLAYGDEYAITTIDSKTGARAVLEAGSEEYDAARKRCKVSTSIYFALAEWTSAGPRMVWPDGLGLYRLRTTSRNTLRNLRAALSHVSAFTGGQVAGIPFDIALDYRDVAGGDGSRRNVPVWTFVMAPPVPLTSRTFTPMLNAAIREGQRLQIAPPAAEAEDVAEADFREMGDDEVIPPLADEELALVAAGGRCDAQHYERVYFAMARGTRYYEDEGRAELVGRYTTERDERGLVPNGLPTTSLAELLSNSTEAEASAFIAYFGEVLDADLKAAKIGAGATVGKERIDTTALGPQQEPEPPSHAARTMARQAAALVADDERAANAAEALNAMMPDDGYADGSARGDADAEQAVSDAYDADRAKPTKEHLDKYQRGIKKAIADYGLDVARWELDGGATDADVVRACDEMGKAMFVAGQAKGVVAS